MAAALLGMTLIPRRPVLLFFAMLSVVVGILTIWPVRPTIIHHLFYLLPEYEGLHLHDPPRVLAVLPIGTALLAAAAIDRIDLVTATRGRAIGTAAILAGFLVGVLTNWGADRPFLSITLISVGILAGSIGMLAIPSARAVLTPRATQAAMAIALIAMALDPAGHVMGTRFADDNNAAQTQAISITSDDSDAGGAGQFLRERAGASDMFRYFGFVGPQGPGFQAHELFAEDWVMPLLINNRAMRLKLYDVQGYDPAQLQRYLATFTALNGFPRDYHEALIYRQGIGSPLLDMLNVRYLVLPSGGAPFSDGGGEPQLPPGYEPVLENRSVVVYENPDALPRAWVVHDARVADQSAALSLIAQEMVDPSVTAVLETAPPSLAPLADGDHDSIEFLTYQPDHVTMNVTAGSDGILLLADSFDPGWSVRVDGHEQTLLAVNGILRGVALPAGSHQVEFVFQPASLRQGLLVTGVAVLVVVVLVGLVLFRPRRFGIADNAI
jgi:hypothetical protein